jgi:hypothetical protein
MPFISIIQDSFDQRVLPKSRRTFLNTIFDNQFLVVADVFTAISVSETASRKVKSAVIRKFGVDSGGCPIFSLSATARYDTMIG